MSKVFVTGDSHFGHRGIVQFTKEDGSKVRPWDDRDKMTEDMIVLWNSVVNPEDLVYHLGDVVINRSYLPVVGKLNGRKKLIAGNHDVFRVSEYMEYFEDIKAYHEVNGYIMSHIPVHTSQLERWKGNIHGHLHNNAVLDEEGDPDKRYFCACVEHTKFKPILLSDIFKEFEKRGL